MFHKGFGTIGGVGHFNARHFGDLMVGLPVRPMQPPCFVPQLSTSTSYQLVTEK